MPLFKYDHHIMLSVKMTVKQSFFRYKEQSIFHLPSNNQSTQNFSLISAERDILPIDISISCFYLSQQPTLRMFAITKQSPHTHIIGKQGQQQRILAIAFEVFKAFPKVGTKQRIRLPFRHIGREVLSWLQLMPIANIRIILPAVQSLKVFYYNYRTLKRWQVCQPHPVLGKGRLTEQAHYTE